MLSRSNRMIPILVILMCGLVGSRLLWSTNPDFFRMEFYGAAYLGPVTLADLCNPNPFAGLESQMSNVTDQRSYSLIYSIPTKVFASFAEALTIHRILSFLLYLTTLIFLVRIGQALELSSIFILFLLSYYGFSEQLLSYLFECKLTLSSVAWLAGALYLFAKNEEYLKAKSRSALFTTSLIPLITVLAYETYCVSRPIALAYWFLAGLLNFSSFNQQKQPLIKIFFSSSVIACLLFHLAHPGVKFDLSLFEGRTESVVGHLGGIKPDWISTIKDRIAELPKLAAWPKHSVFISESFNHCGWLEVWIALITIGISSLVLVRNEKRKLYGLYFRNHRWLILCLVLIMAVSFLTPIFSTKFIRGHRFFGLYLASTILLVTWAEALLRAAPSWLSKIILCLALIASSLTLIHRTPLIYKYKAPSSNDSEGLKQLVSDLKSLALPDNFSTHNEHKLLLLCDQKTPQLWAHSWHAALYFSGLGCRLKSTRLRFLAVKCDCTKVSNEGICLTRSQNDGKNVFSWSVNSPLS